MLEANNHLHVGARAYLMERRLVSPIDQVQASPEAV